MAGPSSGSEAPIAKTMIIVGLVTLLVVALFASGIVGDSETEPKDGGSSSGAATTGAECGGPYVGLSTEDATQKADAADAPWRIGREDDQLFPTTLDFNPSRVTFEIDDGTVTTATCG